MSIEPSPSLGEWLLRSGAIAMMGATMVCFTALDSSAKYLSHSLPTLEVVWARYVAAAIFGLTALSPRGGLATLWPRRPALQILRSLLLLFSTIGNFLALRKLQLAETSTISFLAPLFVVLLAAPFLGERAGGARIAAALIGFLGVLVATRPGTNAFQPVTLLAVGGALSGAGYTLLTRLLARTEAAGVTLLWTPFAGVVFLTPVLPFLWVAPPTLGLWAIMAAMGAFAALGHWLLILAHHRAPAPVLAPFAYTQLVWMIASGFLVFGDMPGRSTLAGAAIVAACGIWLVRHERARAA